MAYDRKKGQHPWREKRIDSRKFEKHISTRKKWVKKMTKRRIRRVPCETTEGETIDMHKPNFYFNSWEIL